VSPRSSKLTKKDPESFDKALAAAQMAEVQRLCAAHTADAVQCLVEVSTNTLRQREPDSDGYFPPVLDDEGNPIRLRYLPGPRTTAANSLLAQAHGRPTQRLNSGEDGRGGITLNVTLQSYADSAPVTVDVTPTRERIGGADPPAERVEAT